MGIYIFKATLEIYTDYRLGCYALDLDIFCDFFRATFLTCSEAQSMGRDLSLKNFLSN